MAERNNGISPGNRGDRGMPIMDWYDVGRLTYVSSIAGRPQVAGRHQARSSEGPILCRQAALSRHFTYPGRGHPGFRPSKPVSPKRQNRPNQLGLNFTAKIMIRYLSWFGKAYSMIYAPNFLRPICILPLFQEKKRRKKEKRLIRFKQGAHRPPRAAVHSFTREGKALPRASPTRSMQSSQKVGQNSTAKLESSIEADDIFLFSITG